MSCCKSCDWLDKGTKMITDKTITITCGECSQDCEGFEAIVAHIFTEHPEYSKDEQQKFALAWLDDAYENQEQQLSSYYDERKLDKAIHSDAFPNK